LASDIRADLATTGTLVENYPLHDLASMIELPEPPEPGELTLAIVDAIHQPLTLEEQETYHTLQTEL
jgi:hypothetical protein